MAERDSATKSSVRRRRHLPKAASSEKPTEEGGAAMDLPNLLKTKAAKAIPAALATREDISPVSAQIHRDLFILDCKNSIRKITGSRR
jgi:hypothetical protein